MRPGQPPLLAQPIAYDLPGLPPHDREQINPQVRDVLRECMYGQSPWPCTLIGPAGTGKTCAALCVIECYAQRWAVQANDLAARLRRAILDGADGELWQQITDMDIMLLDDIGVRERVTDTAYDAVYQTIERRHGRPLIVTSNLGMDDLGRRYDDRVVSRLSGGTWVVLEQGDRRPRAPRVIKL